jgi:hypothetical protein
VNPTTRALLTPLDNDRLRKMRAQALDAATTHNRANRLYMAQLCEERAADCTALLTERKTPKA